MKWVTFLAVFSGLIGLILFQLGLLGLCSDDFMRMYMAVRWADHPVLFQYGIWPPLQSYIYGSVLWLGIPALWVGHLLTALFAGLTVYMVGRVTYAVTSNTKAALFASLLVVTTPVQILLSASMLVEPMYSVWALLLVFFLWQWLTTDVKRYLWFALSACTLLTMSRLDGWPIALALAGFLVYKKRDVSGFGYALVAVAFPICWLLMMLARFGSSFTLFTGYAQSAVHFISSDSVVHFNAFIQFLRFYPVETVALLFLLWRERSNRSIRWIGIGVGATLLFQYLITLNRVAEIFAPRILVVPALLACIAAGTFLSRLRLSTAITLIAIQLMVGGYYLKGYQPDYDREMEKIGVSLANSSTFVEMIKKETIGSDLPTWKLPIVALISGYPDRFRHIYQDPVSSQVNLPYPNTPSTFLIQSPDILAVLKRNIPGARILSLSGASLLTPKLELIHDLQGNH